jgi:general secretion pathway protein J
MKARFFCPPVKGGASFASGGFTLIELLSALLILSLLALMSFRGLGAVLDSRDHVRQETEKWRGVAAFFARFQHDVQLSAPRPLLAAAGRLEFSRLAAADGIDAPRRVGYRLNESREIELLLWPSLEPTPGIEPTRYPLLPAVSAFQLEYLGSDLAWGDVWPRTERDPPLPQGVRLRVVLASGEELVRVFNLK